MKTDFFITNTLTHKKEVFKPLTPHKVALYVCGITPYDYAHMGHARCYITFDLLFRFLSFQGYQVAYCRNFTDIDDKLLNRAQQEYGSATYYQKIAQKYSEAFTNDMELLNCQKPTYEPKVTDHIPAIIQFIQTLIDKQHAYITESGDVYFDITSYKKYGALTNQNLQELQAGIRVAIREEKKNPLDFALWKTTQEEVFWESPWGRGRPGWHIECSVLAYTYLGKQLDIHAGGMDLIFPHHTNEIAQSESCFDCTYSHYWMHNAFVYIHKEKMSKSTGNFFTIRDLFNQYSPELIRYSILTHHYRAPLDFSLGDIEAHKKSYQKIAHLFRNTVQTQIDPKELSKSIVAQKMLSFLYDDLNTSGLFGILFEHYQFLQEHPQERQYVYYILTTILGLTCTPLPEKEISSELQLIIDDLIEKRELARKDKNWALSDQIREQLQSYGINVHDKKSD